MALEGSADSPDNTIGSLPKLFGHIIAFVDNEVLIEDLEDLTALEVCHLEAGNLKEWRIRRNPRPRMPRGQEARCQVFALPYQYNCCGSEARGYNRYCWLEVGWADTRSSSAIAAGFPGKRATERNFDDRYVPELNMLHKSRYLSRQQR